MFNNRIVKVIFMMFIVTASSACAGSRSHEKNQDISLPPEFKRSGMISSSTYQVIVSLENMSEDDAKKEGADLAIEKAASLISQEVFINRNLSMDGRKKIRKLVEEKGKIVRVQKTSDKIYSIVYQVNQPRLKKYLESIH